MPEATIQTRCWARSWQGCSLASFPSLHRRGPQKASCDGGRLWKGASGRAGQEFLAKANWEKKRQGRAVGWKGEGRR